MSVAKIVEVVGSSTTSWEDAVKVAIQKASRTIRGIKGVEVVGWTAIVKKDQIVEYRATMKLSFGVEE